MSTDNQAAMALNGPETGLEVAFDSRDVLCRVLEASCQEDDRFPDLDGLIKLFAAPTPRVRPDAKAENSPESRPEAKSRGRLGESAGEAGLIEPGPDQGSADKPRRERKRRVTVYLEARVEEGLRQVQAALGAELPSGARRVSRSEIVNRALAGALAEHGRKGAKSALARRVSKSRA